MNNPLDFESRVKAVSKDVTGDSLVIEAQSYLRIMGFPIGNFGPNHNGVDGQFGEVTRNAIQTYQILSKQESTDALSAIILIEMAKAVMSGSTFRGFII